MLKNFFTKIVNILKRFLLFLPGLHFFRKSAVFEDAGRWGEKIAENFLRNNHYKILGRRIRAGKHGELDIVAKDGDVLVFVEVKTRKTENYGRPISAVNFWKKKALSRAAIAYLKRLNYPQIYFRFDVVEVVGSPGNSEPVIRHIKDAFKLSSWYYYPRNS